jgi:hypothetical protein
MNKQAFFSLFLAQFKTAFQEKVDWYYQNTVSTMDEDNPDAFGQSMYSRLSEVPSRARAAGYSDLLRVEGIDAVEAFWTGLDREVFEVVLQAVDEALSACIVVIINSQPKMTTDRLTLSVLFEVQADFIVNAAKLSPFQRDARGIVIAEKITVKGELENLFNIVQRPRVATMLLFTRLFPVFPETLSKLPERPLEESNRN